MKHGATGIHRDDENSLSSCCLRLPLCILLLCFTVSTSAVPQQDDTEPGRTDESQKQLTIVYSKDSTLQSSISDALEEDLAKRQTGIRISKVSPHERLPHIADNQLFITFSTENSERIHNTYPDAQVLAIATDPHKYQASQHTQDNEAVLYMTQPYCRQLSLIRMIDKDWGVIGLLKSERRSNAIHELFHCAARFDMEIHSVLLTSPSNLAKDLKQVLSDADLLLALPDKAIYNARSVKNILLTSYRYRKPVIAFSDNFVDAGALASINSNSKQIARSASTLVDDYFSAGNQFSSTINYPTDFNISINRQVFRALQIPVPDIDEMKRQLSTDQKKSKKP